jgi:hypothetical protein
MPMGNAWPEKPHDLVGAECHKDFEDTAEKTPLDDLLLKIAVLDKSFDDGDIEETDYQTQRLLLWNHAKSILRENNYEE